jgi:formamidopyrimidine-DNA glycosylase
MPELPEVETVCRALEKTLIGRTIKNVIVNNPQLRNKIDIDFFSSNCCERTILSLRRRAKYIIAELSGEKALLLHLGMTGKFRIVDQGTQVKKHEHVLFELDNKTSWRYEDARRFGVVKVVTLPVKGALPESLEHLGPEPLEELFTAKYLKAYCKNKTKPIKNLIMDNNCVVGVGNIYASEALFRAKISPLKPAGEMSSLKVSRLIDTIREVLTEAIEAGGTTISDFSAPDGSEGYFFRKLAVYGREHEPCLKCACEIRRKVLAGRSTFYCPKCQK